MFFMAPDGLCCQHIFQLAALLFRARHGQQRQRTKEVAVASVFGFASPLKSTYSHWIPPVDSPVEKWKKYWANPGISGVLNSLKHTHWRTWIEILRWSSKRSWRPCFRNSLPYLPSESLVAQSSQDRNWAKGLQVWALGNFSLSLSTVVPFPVPDSPCNVMTHPRPIKEQGHGPSRKSRIW